MSFVGNEKGPRKSESEDLFQGLSDYLKRELAEKRIDQGYYEVAKKNVIPNLKSWLQDPYSKRFSQNLEMGIRDAILQERWAEIAEAFVQNIQFGTGGIRGKMGFNRDSIQALKDLEKEEGVDARILRGPNTFNDKVLLLNSVGIARYAQEKGLSKIVIGYDSRIQGQSFAFLIAQLFLSYGLTVYFFDEACPYPEVIFAVTQQKADIGITISASHNDYRYNGYKLSCGNGSQFDLEERNYIYENYIKTAKTNQIQLKDLGEAGEEQLQFLGGGEPLPGFNYFGRANRLTDMHTQHVEHVKSFLLRKELVVNQKQSQHPLSIGYCAFHGAGRRAVPRILQELGFSPQKIKRIKQLDELDGMFPCFCSDRGKEQQPDPGDPRAADIAVEAFKQEYPGEFEGLDVLIGTDPDADRCGLIIKVPEEQRHLYGGKNYMLLPADDAWALVIWYRLNWEVETYGAIQNPEKKFIVQSHTTCDSLVKLVHKYGLGVIKSWVGFAMLASSVEMIWNGESLPALQEGKRQPEDPLCHPILYEWQDMDNKRSINVAAMEQSNGFSILGGPPKDKFSMGERGHVRDKDGTFAALLLAEIAAYAKEKKTTLFQLLDEKIFLDPDIGLFINYYEPSPMDGEYEGLAGYTQKKNILMKAMDLHQKVLLQKDITLGNMPILSSCTYLTGKYDTQNWPGFPDEGIRFYFDEERLNYLTIRPSGTSNALRFHAQLHAEDVTRQNLIEKKYDLQCRAKKMVAEIRQILGASA